MVCQANIWSLPPKNPNWKFILEIFACPKGGFRKLPVQKGKSLNIGGEYYLIELHPDLGLLSKATPQTAQDLQTQRFIGRRVELNVDVHLHLK